MANVNEDFDFSQQLLHSQDDAALFTKPQLC
jgi:hypothetical protein